MRARVSTLLIYDLPGPLCTLESALHGQQIEVRQARTCKETSCLLTGPEPPELIFTDTTLPDGDWTDVVRLAGEAHTPINVIVVSRLVDGRLYIETIERGAFDFIVPPFEASDLAYVVRCAAGNAARRRRTEA